VCGQKSKKDTDFLGFHGIGKFAIGKTKRTCSTE
jgi:hypothetical protein